VRHETAMLSLPAAADKEAVLGWAKKLERQGVDAGAEVFVIEPKVDGLAVRAVYRWEGVRFVWVCTYVWCV
jgi:NAD-dependent DNA ligase